MNGLRARVSRLDRAAWALRAESPVPCGLPFALAMMTDARRHPDLVRLIAALPRNRPILIVFRHYGLAPAPRAALCADALRAARRAGHVMVVAGGGAADGAHNVAGPGLRTASVHSLRQGAARRALRPDLALVSPVFPTRSHPASPALGSVRADAIARRLHVPAFALGGVDAGNAARLAGTAFTGIAALGAFAP